MLSFPKVVFDLSECSIIAITLALTIPDGRIALTRYEKESTYGYPYKKYDFRNRIRVVTEYGDTVLQISLSGVPLLHMEFSAESV